MNTGVLLVTKCVRQILKLLRIWSRAVVSLLVCMHVLILFYYSMLFNTMLFLERLKVNTIHTVSQFCHLDASLCSHTDNAEEKKNSHI